MNMLPHHAHLYKTSMRQMLLQASDGLSPLSTLTRLTSLCLGLKGKEDPGLDAIRQHSFNLDLRVHTMQQ